MINTSDQWYTAGKIFTGDEWLEGTAIQVRNGTIVDLVPVSRVVHESSFTDFGDKMIVPGLIDLQIYGAYQKLFAVYPEPDSLYKLRDYCRAGGAVLCMPTVATNSYDVFFRCIDAIREYWSAGGDGIAGLHVEGPWINPVKRGAHNAALIHAPTMEQARQLLDYGEGVIRIITLAPEVCSPEVVQLVMSRGVVVSAGHSNATYEEAVSSFASGIRTVTHLFNAMSPLHHRAPGLPGATMDQPGVMASIIPDGHHVDWPVIRIARSVMKDRLFVITDAVTETTDGYYRHELAGDKYESGGILSGSALDMAKAVSNLVARRVAPPEEALRMCSLYPARVMGWDGKLGKIRPGYRAGMAVMHRDFRCDRVIANGI